MFENDALKIQKNCKPDIICSHIKRHFNTAYTGGAYSPSILMGICKSNDTQDSEIWQDSDDSRDNLWFIKYITALYDAEDHFQPEE